MCQDEVISNIYLSIRYLKQTNHKINQSMDFHQKKKKKLAEFPFQLSVPRDAQEEWCLFSYQDQVVLDESYSCLILQLAYERITYGQTIFWANSFPFA